MGSFHLPHQHGERTHTEDLHRELTNIEHFTAVSDVFKQLSDPTRVRIFWLLSHREECVVNIAAMLDMSSPAISHHLRSLTEGGILESRRALQTSASKNNKAAIDLLQSNAAIVSIVIICRLL